LAHWVIIRPNTNIRWVHTLWDPILFTKLNVPVLCLYLAWWWLNEPKHVAEFLIFITIYVVFIDWVNYYIITKHNGMAIKNDSVGFHVISYQSLYISPAAKFWLHVGRKPSCSSDVRNGKLSFSTQDALLLREGRSAIKLSPHLSAATPVNITIFHKTTSSIRRDVISAELDLKLALLKSENPKWRYEGSY
jgi:hypothetical protein